MTIPVKTLIINSSPSADDNASQSAEDNSSPSTDDYDTQQSEVSHV